jgi:type II secretory pathway pseudopilin PulG
MSCLHVTKYRRTASAFTLVEALLAITILALAGSVLLLGTTTSVETAKTGLYCTIARGMAQQLMDEIVGSRYCELGSDAYQSTLGPGADETTRQMYDDSDDYNGLRTKPPKDFYGIALGKDDGLGGQRNALFQVPSGFFDNWQQEVDVYYVGEANLSTKLPAGQYSDYRVVEVRIVYIDPNSGRKELANLKRVVSYVPPLQ